MEITQFRNTGVDEKCEHQKWYRYIHNWQSGNEEKTVNYFSNAKKKKMKSLQFGFPLNAYSMSQ